MSIRALLFLVAILQVLYLCYTLWYQLFATNAAGVPKQKNNLCKVPIGGFKAWNEGIVTVIKPEIKKNCSKLISGDILETEQVTQLSVDWNDTFFSEMFSEKAQIKFVEMSANCDWLTEYMTNNLYNTELEVSFPVAYNFLVYDSPQQFLRLLRLLYRPQNVYCIHPDKKSVFFPFFNNVSKCFHNIITATELMAVHWGEYTIMDAQISCLSDLVNYREKQDKKNRWKYVINLCGKELPLHTTKEIVKKLISMEGTSVVYTRFIPDSELKTTKRLVNKTLPYNLTFYKSMTYTALSVPFVTFLVRNNTAQSLYNFFRGLKFPEEHFYATLFHMPGTPGGYNGEIAKEKWFTVSSYIWRKSIEDLALPCYGRTVHGICIVNHADLPRIMQMTRNGSKALFHNKYFMEDNHVIMDCMEERIVAMNKLEYELDCSKIQFIEV